MKIVFIAQPTDVLPSKTGSSIAIWIDELARRLNSENDVYVCCADVDEPSPDDNRDYQIIRVSTATDEKVEQFVGSIERRLPKIGKSDRPIYYRYYYFSSAYYWFYAWVVSRALREIKPDWIIVSNFSQFVPTLRFWNKKSRIFLMMHCDWLVEMPKNIVQKRLAFVDAVGGCSNYIIDGVNERFQNLSAKCHALHNGSDVKRFRKDISENESSENLRRRLDMHSKKIVLFVGRIAPEKGVHVLLEAMQTVRREIPDAVLVVAGNISRQPPSPKLVFDNDPGFAKFESMNLEYRVLIENLAGSLAGNIRLIGHINHYELAEYYNLADVFVHPAIWNEPFGMTLTEAMACEKAVIATKVGGIPEIVRDGETGIMVSPGSPGELAQAIIRLLQDDRLREQMGRRGRSVVQSLFSWEKTVEALRNTLTAGTK